MAKLNEQQLMVVVPDATKPVKQRFAAAIALGESIGDVPAKRQKLLLVINNPDEKEEIVLASLWALWNMGGAGQGGHNSFPSQAVVQVAQSGRSHLTRTVAMFALRNSTDINKDHKMTEILDGVAKESKPDCTRPLPKLQVDLALKRWIPCWMF